MSTQPPLTRPMPTGDQKLRVINRAADAAMAEEPPTPKLDSFGSSGQSNYRIGPLLEDVPSGVTLEQWMPQIRGYSHIVLN